MDRLGRGDGEGIEKGWRRDRWGRGRGWKGGIGGERGLGKGQEEEK